MCWHTACLYTKEKVSNVGFFLFCVGSQLFLFAARHTHMSLARFFVFALFILSSLGTPCTPGTYSATGQGQCLQCPTGMDSTSGSTACSVACGFFQDVEDEVVRVCPVDFFCA